MELARNFRNFFSRLENVRSWDELVYLFESQTVAVQWLLGISSFGVLVLLWVFIVAIFIDKHE